MIDPEPTLASRSGAVSQKSCGASKIRASPSSRSSTGTSWPTPRSVEEDPGVALALTDDFHSFERLGLVMQPDDKDAALLPRRINGSFALLHRPIDGLGRARLDLLFSRTCATGVATSSCCPARRGGVVGCQPRRLVATAHRDVARVAHAVSRRPANRRRVSVSTGRGAVGSRDRRALPSSRRFLDLRARGAVRTRGRRRLRHVPVRLHAGADGDTINLYYGAADTSVAMATGSVRQLLDWLETARSGWAEGRCG